jgi:bacterioferritin-associated ferredoxin
MRFDRISQEVGTSVGTPTVAGEAVRAGRPAVGRSFRLHRSRGPICADGYCFQCEIDTPTGRALACRVPAGEASRRRLDPLRPLGRVAERWPPWFWERRFLRPFVARRPYLELLRRLSSAPPLHGTAPVVPDRSWRVEETDTAVVGDGGTVGGVPLGLYGDRVLAVLRPDALVALRFERLVVAEASYSRLPPIEGNDLPGVLGLSAWERYVSAGGPWASTRVAVWGGEGAQTRVRTLAAQAGVHVVWASEQAPQRLVGRGRVQAVDVGERVPCDVFVVGVAQPALELALQAGGDAVLTRGELAIVAAGDLPAWIELRGAGAERGSGVPDVPAADAAFACLCEDVRVRDIRAAVAAGFDHPELVKRRTGAMTGPCQGKLCTPLVLSLLRDLGAEHAPTRSRPLVRPVRLADLAARA